MAFTDSDAKQVVGDSTDWAVGLAASLRKWEQIVEEERAGEDTTYGRNRCCGLCFVTNNSRLGCKDCPACQICMEIEDGLLSVEVLELLQEIDLDEWQRRLTSASESRRRQGGYS